MILLFGKRRALVWLFVYQCTGDSLLQSFAAHIFSNYFAVAIKQESGRDAFDAVFDGQFIAPTLSVEELLPGHVLILGETQQFCLFLIEADTDDVETLRMIFLIGGNDI